MSGGRSEAQASMSAAISSAAATSAATVRTLFHAVQAHRYRCHTRRRLRAVRFERDELIVERDVLDDGHRYGAEEIEQPAGEHERRGRLVERERGPSRQRESCHAGTEQCRHEERRDCGDVDRPHRGCSHRRGQPAEARHDKGREREEDAGHEPAAEGGQQRRRLEDAGRHARALSRLYETVHGCDAQIHTPASRISARARAS